MTIFQDRKFVWRAVWWTWKCIYKITKNTH